VRLGFLVSIEGINGKGTMEEDEEIHARSSRWKKMKKLG
jgi:hypothetical protein